MFRMYGNPVSLEIGTWKTVFLCTVPSINSGSCKMMFFSVDANKIYTSYEIKDNSDIVVSFNNGTLTITNNGVGSLNGFCIVK